MFAKLKNLGISHKLVVIFFLMALPIGVLLSLFVSNLGSRVIATRNEQSGLEYIKELRHLADHLSLHQGAANAALQGADGFRSQITALQSRIDSDFTTLEGLDQKSGALLKTTPGLAQLKNTWQELRMQVLTLPAASGFEPNRQTESLPRDPPLNEARRALAEGDYVLAAELTVGSLNDGTAAVIHVRALANLEPAKAESACGRAVDLHPLSEELHFLHAVLLIDLNRTERAIQALRRVIYLDRSLAIAHFTLGSLMIRTGDTTTARRAYRNARDLCADRPAEELVPLSDGEYAGRLAKTADNQLAILDRASEAMR